VTTGEIVAMVVYFATVAGSVVFVVRRLMTRFWRWPEGIALLLQHLMLVGFGAQVGYVLTVGGGQWWQLPLYVVLLAGFGFSVWWLTILQELVMKQARTARQEPPPPETHPLVEDHQIG
jgi:hypothetical protein